jgi:hypothetical protein
MTSRDRLRLKGDQSAQPLSLMLPIIGAMAAAGQGSGPKKLTGRSDQA